MNEPREIDGVEAEILPTRSTEPCETSPLSSAVTVVRPTTSAPAVLTPLRPLASLALAFIARQVLPRLTVALLRDLGATRAGDERGAADQLLADLSDRRCRTRRRLARGDRSQE